MAIETLAVAGKRIAFSESGLNHGPTCRGTELVLPRAARSRKKAIIKLKTGV